jgi:hypothetical protein
MDRRSWFGCLVLAAALALPAVAGASTFLALSPEELVAESAAVVQGEVLQVNSFWHASGRVIVSEALVRVEEVVVGDAPSVVVLRSHGGEVGGFTVVAHGFPTFRVGERLLLFVESEADGASEVTGYRQGQYRIVTDKAGVEIAVPTMERGVRLLDKRGAMAARPEPVRLDAFKDQIRVLDRHVRAQNRTTGEVR